MCWDGNGFEFAFVLFTGIVYFGENGCQCIHSCLQIGNRCDELGILSSGGSKADNADMAAKADLTILLAISSFIDDIDELFSADFQISQRSASQAPLQWQAVFHTEGARLHWN